MILHLQSTRSKKFWNVRSLEELAIGPRLKVSTGPGPHHTSVPFRIGQTVTGYPVKTFVPRY